LKTPSNQKKLGTQRLKNSAPKSADEGPGGTASTRRQSSTGAAEMDASASKYVGYWYANISPFIIIIISI
jgi:hypothetical protein